MSRMIRKQIYIEPRQEKLLRQLARELGVSEAELIRRGIDQVVDAFAGFPLDHGAWEAEKAFIMQHRRFPAPQTGRSWTRDELYEDRLERYSR